MAKKESDKDKNKKKKSEETPLDKKALEEKFNLENKDKDKDKKKPVIFKPKQDFNFELYQKKRSSAADYKPETFIKMSEAFQELTYFPGIPQGHVHMVYGNSDVGKTTMLLELAKNAQEQGVLPVFVITEKKWSWPRAEAMGIRRDFCIFNDNLMFIEEACDFINQIIKDQAEGSLPYDIVFLWDSVGATPSRAEWEADEEHKKQVNKVYENGEDIRKVEKTGGAMMVTARVLRDQIERKIQHKITATRNAKFPYFATLFIVNHGYISPNPMGPASLVPYGGGGIKLACSFVFRQGKVSGNATKVANDKNGVSHTWGLEVPLLLEKNHINGISREGKVIVTPYGFIPATKEAKDAYVKEHSKDWADSFNQYYEENSGDDAEPDMDVDMETGEIL